MTIIGGFGRRLLGIGLVGSVLAVAILPAGPASAEPVTITNGTQFVDTDGNVVHAHGGGILKVGGYYYLFGENRGNNHQFQYVSAYRSTDLATWEFRNHILTQASDPELQVANIERPKVIYNESTGQYVMWAHKENGVDYTEARAAVAVSDTVDGDYTWLGSFRPFGHDSRDITAFVDDDGTGYMISAARVNLDLHIYRLSPDYTEVEELVHVFDGDHREAPAVFKRGSTYFLVTSGASGWNPNQQQYATAPSLTGPWSGWQNLGNSTGFGSQTTFVLPIEGTETTSYLYLGDRWAPATGGLPNDSEYVWLPLEFTGQQSMTMNWSPQITIDTETGRVSGTGGGDPVGLIARHSGKCADVVNQSTADDAEVIQYTCNGGWNQQWQFQDAGQGYVRIVAWHSGKCLDVRGGSTANNARVVQNPCAGGTSQQWRLEDAGDGYDRLINRSSGRCLDVISGSIDDGTRLIQYDCNGTSNQQWRRT